MNAFLRFLVPVSFLTLLIAPLSVFADTAIGGESALDQAFTGLYYLSAIGFLVASIIMAIAVSGFGRSTLGSIFSFLFMGTLVFFVITIFQTLGGEFFGIGDESMDIWWHVMFYLAFLLYFLGLKHLVKLGQAESDPGNGKSKGAIVWGIVALLILIGVFTLPQALDGVVTAYATSPLAEFGLHHFLAFAFAGLLATYLVSAKEKLGQIGKAVAGPMIIAVAALSLQHFWELLTESWRVISVTSSFGEGIEKIFLITAAVCVLNAAWRLKKFSRPS